MSWKTKKQSTVSRSSAEAKYRSMTATTSELMSLGVFFTTPMRLYCDSQEALDIAKNPVFHERMKHIEIHSHFVREKLESGNLAMSYLPFK